MTKQCTHSTNSSIIYMTQLPFKQVHAANTVEVIDLPVVGTKTACHPLGYPTSCVSRRADLLRHWPGESVSQTHHSISVAKFVVEVLYLNGVKNHFTYASTTQIGLFVRHARNCWRLQPWSFYALNANSALHLEPRAGNQRHMSFHLL